MTPAISVCIVTHGRHVLLADCLGSLAAQRDAPPYEVLVALDDDPLAATVVRRHVAGAAVVDVRGITPGAARNLLAGRARGEVVLYLDDDVVCPAGLLTELWALALARPSVGVFGGANLTPPGSGARQRSQGEALASTIGAGPLRRRFRVGPPGAADERHLMLCNLAFRRAALLPFPSDLRTAEENAVLATLARDGASMRHDAALSVHHHRRTTYGAFARQVHGWGIGRAHLARRQPATLRPLHLVPAALAVYVALLPLLVVAAGHWAAAGALVYTAAVGTWSLGGGRRAGSRMLCVLVLHLAYGLGVLRGLLTRGAQ